MKRLMVWLWMLVTVMFFRTFIIALGPTVAMWAEESGQTNCLLDALRRYWKDGGFIVVTPSPHVKWIFRWWWTRRFEIFSHYSPAPRTVRRWDPFTDYGVMPLTFEGWLEVSSRDGMVWNRADRRSTDAVENRIACDCGGVDLGGPRADD